MYSKYTVALSCLLRFFLKLTSIFKAALIITRVSSMAPRMAMSVSRSVQTGSLWMGI